MRRKVTGIDAAFAVLESLRPRTAIFDIEPVVTRWGSTRLSLLSGLERVERRADAFPWLSHLVFMTNSARKRAQPERGGRLDVTYLSRAKKPWRLAQLGALPSPAVVIGDQVLTDGVLAWRMRGRECQFVQVPLGSGPWWPRAQSVLGEFVAPLLFADR